MTGIPQRRLAICSGHPARTDRQNAVRPVIAVATPRYPTLTQLPRPHLKRSCSSMIAFPQARHPHRLQQSAGGARGVGVENPGRLWLPSVTVGITRFRISDATDENGFLIGETASNILVGVINHQSVVFPPFGFACSSTASGSKAKCCAHRSDACRRARCVLKCRELQLGE